jgi:hypothetical protein
MDILLVDILSEIIIGYWWLLMDIILMTIGDYFISG